MGGKGPRPAEPSAFWALPILATLALVPLVVYLRVVPLDGVRFDYWNGQRANYDFFSFYKARLILGLAALVACGALVGLLRRTSGLRRLPAPAGAALAVFAVLAIASAWASPFPDIALSGFPDRYEGLGVLLAYVVIALASFAVLGSPARARAAITCLAVSACAVGSIGLLQYAGLDPFESAWGRALILPEGSRHLAPTLKFATEPRTIYATLYHYNYVGSYAALVFPLMLGLLVSGEWPTRVRRLVLLAAVFSGLLAILSGSRAGLVGSVSGMPVLAALERDRLHAHRRAVLETAALLLVAVVAGDVALGGRLLSRAGSVASDAAHMLGPRQPAVRMPPLELAAIGDRAVRLRTPAGLLELRHEDGNVSAQDDDQRPLNLAFEGQSGRFKVDDPRFAQLDCSLGRINGQPALVVRSEAYTLNFLLLDSGIRAALKTGRIVDPWKAESAGFAGRESLGSARGYIWSRSLPLLSRAPLLGAGPDTFAAVFPQQDVTGKFMVYGTTDMLVDKAHNFYLQTALNTGIPSALVLVVLFAWYLWRGARLFGARRGGPGQNRASPQDATAGPPAKGRALQSSEQRNPAAWRAVGVGCVAGVAGYLASMLFNDSVVSVAPVFWVALGLGMRANLECIASDTRTRSS